MLLERRWLAGHALVLFFAVAFVLLGIWQFNRNNEKHAKVRAARAAYAAPAPDITAASGLGSGSRVQAAGTFDPAHEALLRDQVHGDQVGNAVLTPLRLADGTAVVVDRGWIAGDTVVPPPATGSVVARGLLHDSRALSSQDSVQEVGGRLSLPRVDIARLDATVPYRLRDVWIEAQSLQPNAPGAPALPQPPAPDQVNHMQYAIEWFLLALIPIVGWPIVLVRARRRRSPGA